MDTPMTSSGFKNSPKQDKDTTDSNYPSQTNNEKIFSKKLDCRQTKNRVN